MTTLHTRETYRGVQITIEQADHRVVGEPEFAAHVPLHQHAYIDRYFKTADGALMAARALIDERMSDGELFVLTSDEQGTVQRLLESLQRRGYDLTDAQDRLLRRLQS